MLVVDGVVVFVYFIIIIRLFEVFYVQFVICMYLCQCLVLVIGGVLKLFYFEFVFVDFGYVLWLYCVGIVLF